MPPRPEPSEDNGYLQEHVAMLRRSFRHWTGRDLLDPRMSDVDAARYLYDAPFVVVSHDTSPDPIFNYGNRTAQELFGLNWDEFTALPSRLSAEPASRSARDRVLHDVDAHGFIEHYTGFRIARHGRRFVIQDAVIWNLLDPNGLRVGQAASFHHWKFL